MNDNATGVTDGRIGSFQISNGLLTQSEKIALVQSQTTNLFIKLLNESKSKISSLIGDSSHATVVNAVTIEAEARLIGNVITSLENYKNGRYEN